MVEPAPKTSPPKSLAKIRPTIMATRKVLPFAELSPVEFELMCLALIEREGYSRPQHLGLAGSEQGRDITAYKITDEGKELRFFQCKRYDRIDATTFMCKNLNLIQQAAASGQHLANNHRHPTG